jgi:ATP-binding cassette, subfamily B, beta-glucan exporter
MTIAALYRRALALLGDERGLAGVLALASVAIGLIQLAEPVLFGRVVDAISNPSKGTGAFPLIGLWAALGLVGIGAGVAVSVISDRLAHRHRLAAIGAAFERAMALPLGFHAERGSGAVIRTVLSGTDSLFGLWLSVMREQLTAITGLLFLVPTAISMDWRMALILVVLAVAYVFINLLVIGKTRAGQSQVERYHADVSGRVGDVLGNVTIVQSYTRLAAEAQAMRDLMSELLRAQYPVLTWWGILTVMQRASATITMVAVFAVGALLAERGELTVGQIVAFVGFAGLLIGKLDQISGFVISINQRAPSLRNYFALLDEPALIADARDATPVRHVAGAVRYDNVSFTFADKTPGLYDITLDAAPGATVALVGPSGSGKTTTLSLLLRLRAPDRGRILVDGRDIATITLDSLRHHVAVVFQDAGLFNRSIAENVGIGRAGASQAEIEEACRLAEAHDFIAAKPGGYDFVIGERGASLSGGERQRLSIARAILKDAPILILDEATSALDAQTEARIKRALDRLRSGRTTFIIAHRLSTVANADTIYVLDKGRIVEHGTFDGLTQAGGLFSHMVAEGGFTVPQAVEASPAAALTTQA